MKKFFKFLLGFLVVAATIGGILYFVKNYLMKDYLDDYDDDFDNDLYDEDDEDDRDYVTLTPENKAEEDTAEKEEDTSEEKENTESEEALA